MYSVSFELTNGECGRIEGERAAVLAELRAWGSLVKNSRPHTSADEAMSLTLNRSPVPAGQVAVTRYRAKSAVQQPLPTPALNFARDAMVTNPGEVDSSFTKMPTSAPPRGAVAAGIVPAGDIVAALETYTSGPNHNQRPLPSPTINFGEPQTSPDPWRGTFAQMRPVQNHGGTPTNAMTARPTPASGQRPLPPPTINFDKR